MLLCLFIKSRTTNRLAPIRVMKWGGEMRERREVREVGDVGVLESWRLDVTLTLKLRPPGESWDHQWRVGWAGLGWAGRSGGKWRGYYELDFVKTGFNFSHLIGVVSSVLCPCDANKGGGWGVLVVLCCSRDTWLSTPWVRVGPCYSVLLSELRVPISEPVF